MIITKNEELSEPNQTSRTQRCEHGLLQYKALIFLQTKSQFVVDVAQHQIVSNC